MSCYVFLEGDLPTRELIDVAIREMGNMVGQTGFDSMMDVIDMEDRAIHGMYKIIRDKIQHYFYKNTDDVSIVYKGKCLTLNFVSIQDAGKFINSLPESATSIDEATYGSLRK